MIPPIRRGQLRTLDRPADLLDVEAEPGSTLTRLVRDAPQKISPLGIETGELACSPAVDADGTILGRTRMVNITDYPGLRAAFLQLLEWLRPGGASRAGPPAAPGRPDVCPEWRRRVACVKAVLVFRWSGLRLDKHRVRVSVIDLEE